MWPEADNGMTNGDLPELTCPAGVGQPFRGPADGLTEDEWDSLVAQFSPTVTPSRCALDASIVDWNQAWSTDWTATDWLFEPLLARGRGHALVAAAKSGKSLLMLATAAEIATRGGPEGIGRNVLYLDYEMTIADVMGRLRSFGYSGSTDLTRLKYSVLPQISPLDTAAGAAELVQFALDRATELVVIDTTSRALAGNENDSDTVQNFFRLCGARLKAAGITWIRLDHAGKDQSKGARGSSAKNDDVDVVWSLSTSTSHGLRLEATHRRIDWVPRSILVHQENDSLGILRFSFDQSATSPDARRVVAVLDDLGLPNDLGREPARKHLKDAGVGASTDSLAEAVKYRKSR